MVKPEDRTPLLHDPSGSGVIGRQGSESIDDAEGRAEVSSNSAMFARTQESPESTDRELCRWSTCPKALRSWKVSN